MRALQLLLLVTAAVLPACRQAPPPEEPPGAGGEIPPPEPPPPPEPVEAPFEATAVQTDGSRVALDEGGRTTLPPPERIELGSEIAFREVRVRLLDAQDRLVPSTDTMTIGQGTQVRLVPVEPLETGKSYKLRVDALEGSGPIDIEGTDYLPRTIAFTVEEPEKDEGEGGSAAP